MLSEERQRERQESQVHSKGQREQKMLGTVGHAMYRKLTSDQKGPKCQARQTRICVQAPGNH